MSSRRMARSAFHWPRPGRVNPPVSGHSLRIRRKIRISGDVSSCDSRRRRIQTMRFAAGYSNTMYYIPKSVRIFNRSGKKASGWRRGLLRAAGAFPAARKRAPCAELPKAFRQPAPFIDSYCHRFSAALISPTNSGCGLLGRLLNSGWNCTPTKKSSPGISTVSTRRPSGERPDRHSPAFCSTSR